MAVDVATAAKAVEAHRRAERREREEGEEARRELLCRAHAIAAKAAQLMRRVHEGSGNGGTVETRSRAAQNASRIAARKVAPIQKEAGTPRRDEHQQTVWAGARAAEVTGSCCHSVAKTVSARFARRPCEHARTVRRTVVQRQESCHEHVAALPEVTRHVRRRQSIDANDSVVRIDLIAQPLSAQPKTRTDERAAAEMLSAHAACGAIKAGYGVACAAIEA